MYHNDYFLSGSAHRADESRYGVTATPGGRRCDDEEQDEGQDGGEGCERASGAGGEL